MLSRDVRVLSACGLGMSGDCPHAVRDVRVLSACCQGMSGYCPRAVQGCPGLLSACCLGMAAWLACLQCSMMMATTIVIPNETIIFLFPDVSARIIDFPMFLYFCLLLTDDDDDDDRDTKRYNCFFLSWRFGALFMT